jgi:hypothetical protein
MENEDCIGVEKRGDIIAVARSCLRLHFEWNIFFAFFIWKNYPRVETWIVVNRPVEWIVVKTLEFRHVIARFAL